MIIKYLDMDNKYAEQSDWKNFFHAERSSVCMADDCNAPNAADLAYDPTMLLSDFMAVIMKYVPDMSNCKWVILFDKEKVAVLTGHSDRKYTYELLVPDCKMEELAGKSISCRYYSGAH